ncbi:UDP-glucose 4-epimerase GalE, partial [bacterium]|nr:UDP-glucose 4-epimerase GalE [bacterium]
MRILITGGAGYVGSHTVKELLARDHYPIVYDNLSQGHKEAVLGGELIVGDLANQEELRKCFAKYKVEAVIHFAASCYVAEAVKNPARYYENNVVNGLHLLKMMLEFGVKKIVFSSSCAIYGIPIKIPIPESHSLNPINPYGMTKLIFEKILKDYERAYRMKYISLRYFNAAGADESGKIGEDHNPETHLIPLVLQTALGQKKNIEIFGTDYDTPDKTCIRDYIHVSDLARAHILALEKLTKEETSDIFNLGLGKGCSVREVIETARKITKKPIRVVETGRRAGDPPQLVADASKAERELNWRPKYTKLEDIIQTAWKWHKNNP